MKLLADYFPLLLFFIAFKLGGIYVATAVGIVASIAQLLYFRMVVKHIAVVHWIGFVTIVVFGGATLILRDDAFIRWKPTVLFALFASILALGKFMFRRDLLRHVLPLGVEMPARVWTTLTWCWVGFLVFMSGVNWYIAFHFPLDVWVTFKVPVTMGLFLVFGVIQALIMSRHLADEPKA